MALLAKTCATDAARKRRAAPSCYRLERQLVRIFEHGHGLLTRYLGKTIEVFIKAEAAFQIGE
jgi:hypothetical protein